MCNKSYFLQWCLISSGIYIYGINLNSNLHPLHMRTWTKWLWNTTLLHVEDKYVIVTASTLLLCMYITTLQNIAHISVSIWLECLVAYSSVCRTCDDNSIISVYLNDVPYFQWLGGSEFSGGLATSDSYSGDGSPPQHTVVSVPEPLWGRQCHYISLCVHLPLCFIMEWRLLNGLYSKANRWI